MRKIKALLALILAVSMLLGSSEITALAETLAGDVLDTALLEEETYETTGEEITDVSSSEEALTPYEETGESEAEEVEEIEEVDESEEDFVQVQNDAEFSFAYTVLDAGAKKARLDGLSEGQTASGDLIIPGTIDGYTIVEIGEGAFDEVDGFTGTLSIPDTVTTIDDYAFYETGFTGKVVIPESVTSIGKEVFTWCDGITEIENKGSAALEMSWVDAGLLVWKSETTGYLTNIVQPGDTVSKYTSGELLGQYVYSEDLKLNYAVTGATTISITRYEGLLGEGEDLIIPSAISEYTVTEIASGAFDCDYANHENDFTGGLSIPNTVTKIGSWAFCCCGFTGSLVLPENLEIIGHAAFDYCCGLTGSLVIPDSVTAIGENAFYNCGFTGEVIIPSGVIEIGEGILGSCHGITRIVNNSVVEFDAPKCDGGWISESTGERATVVAAGGTVTKLAAQEYIYSDTLKIKYVEYTSTVSITGYEGKLGEGEDLIIPTTISGKNVTEIGSSAFSCSKSADYNNFTGNLELPDNLVLIGINAFERCAFTGNLQLPEGLESIGNYAFYRCGGFTGSLVLPDGLKSVGACAFYYCTGFNGNLVISDSVTEIGNDAFYYCRGFIGDLIIPDSVTKMGYYAFYNCGFTGKLVISENLTRIESGAFSCCTKLTGDLIIPEKVTSIGYDAFNSCNGFTEDLEIPSGVTKIEWNAFRGCQGLKGKLTIPSSVTQIEGEVFYYCEFKYIENESHVSLDVPPTISGSHKWYDAVTGEVITVIASGSIAIRDDFDGVLYELKTEVLAGDPTAVKIVGYDGVISGDINIPATIDGYTVKEIADEAFKGAIGIRGDFTIPSSVTSIGTDVIAGCSGITRVINNGSAGIGLPVVTGRTWQDADDSSTVTVAAAGKTAVRDDYAAALLFDYSVTSETNKTAKITGFKEDKLPIGDLVIPSVIDGYTVTEIGRSAFNDVPKNGELSGSLIIPDTVETIGECAFIKCEYITGDLVIPDSVTSIGDYAFDQCKGLEGTLTLGSGLTSIGDYAFYYDNFTGALSIPDSVTIIGDNAFWRCEGFTSLSLGSNLETIGESAFNNCIGFTGDLVIPESVTSIGEHAFQYCIGLDGSLILNDGLEYIGNNAFRDCNNLKGDIIIPDTVTYLGTMAFYNCRGFDGKLVIGEGLEVIPYAAFCYCKGLTGSLTLGSNVTTVGEGAFDGDEGLIGSLVLGDKITSIGSNAFINCCGLTGSVVIPETVTEIGEYAFYGCFGLNRFDNKSEVEVALPLDVEHYWTMAGTSARISALSAGKTALRNDYMGDDALRYGFEWEEEYFYTGNAIKPDVVVYCGENPLARGIDYTVSYKNNTKVYEINEGEAGFKASKAPTITITLKGNYSGKKVMYFIIKSKNIADGDIYVENIPLAVESSKAYKPAPVIHGVEKKLKNKSDYTYAYYSDAECTTSVTPKYAGIYRIKITGKGGYTGSVIKEFEIKSSEYKLVSKLKVDKIPNQEYTGERIFPDVVVKDGTTALVKDVDYTLDYATNMDIGTATVTITGTGTKYLGTQKVTFKIVGKTMSKVKVSGTALTASYIYNGEEHKLNLSDITAVYKASSKATPESLYIVDSSDYYSMSYAETLLVDAYVTYENNRNAGKATMILNGVNKYSGKLKKTFKIKTFDLKTNKDNAVTIEFGSEYYEYHKAGSKPVPVVKINGRVVDTYMYKISYVNNTVLYGGTKHSSVKITGKKNFVNSISKEFKIICGNLSDTDSITVTAPVKVYADKAGNWKNTVTVKDQGKALKAGADYSKNIVYTYKDIPEGLDVKDGSVKSKPVVERNIGDVVGDKDIVPAGTIIQAEITCDTNGKYAGTTYGEWKIIGKDIGKLKATIKSRTFTGSEITLGADDITFKGKAPGEVTYEIVSYSNNINKGKASVVIRGTGNYGGTLTVTFNITSKGFTWWMFR